MKIVMFLFLLSGCSIFFGSSEGPKSAKGKLYTISFSKPGWSYKINNKSDYIFENKDGQILLSNSFCEEFQSEPLDRLAKKTFTGLKNFKQTINEYTTFHNREAYSLEGSGVIDGVKVNLKLLNTRRDNCYYDFVYISPATNKLKSEDFSDFLKTVIFP